MGAYSSASSNEGCVTNLGYTWTFNFRECYEEKQVGEFVTSPVFTDRSKRKWQLVLYPRGDCENNKNYLSLYLEVLGESGETASPWFWLSLVDIHNNTVHKTLFTEKYCAIDGKKLESMWGLSRFVPCVRILDANSELLHKNSITIRYVECLDNDYEQVLTHHKEPPETEFLEPTPKIYDDYSNLLRKQRFSDVILLSADGKEFPAHKAILSARSPYFAVKFDHETEGKYETVLEDTRGEVLGQVLQYIYAGQADESNLMSQELLVAAGNYGLDDLKDSCEQCICAGIEIDNAMDLLVFADLHDAKALKTTATNFLIENAKGIVMSVGFSNVEKSRPHLIAEACQKMALQ